MIFGDDSQIHTYFTCEKREKKKKNMHLRVICCTIILENKADRKDVGAAKKSVIFIHMLQS